MPWETLAPTPVANGTLQLAGGITLSNNITTQVGNFTWENVSGNNTLNVRLGTTCDGAVLKSDSGLETFIDTDGDTSNPGPIYITGAGNVQSHRQRDH